LASCHTHTHPPFMSSVQGGPSAVAVRRMNSASRGSEVSVARSTHRRLKGGSARSLAANVAPVPFCTAVSTANSVPPCAPPTPGDTNGHTSPPKRQAARSAAKVAGVVPTAACAVGRTLHDQPTTRATALLSRRRRSHPYLPLVDAACMYMQVTLTKGRRRTANSRPDCENHLFGRVGGGARRCCGI